MGNTIAYVKNNGVAAVCVDSFDANDAIMSVPFASYRIKSGQTTKVEALGGNFVSIGISGTSLAGKRNLYWSVGSGKTLTVNGNSVSGGIPASGTYPLGTRCKLCVNQRTLSVTEYLRGYENDGFALPVIIVVALAILLILRRTGVKFAHVSEKQLVASPQFSEKLASIEIA